MTLNMEGNSLNQQPAVRSTSSRLTAADHREIIGSPAGGSTGAGTGSSRACTPLGGLILQRRPGLCHGQLHAEFDGANVQL